MALTLVVGLVLLGCGRRETPAPAPGKPPGDPDTLFPRPTEFQRTQLGQLDGYLRGSVTNLDLSWVIDMGPPAVPTMLKLAADETYPVEARDLILITLGNVVKKTGLLDERDERNEVVVPVVLKALGSEEPRVRRSAAFVARFVDDARLVPVLRAMLPEKDFVQEQAVLALGSSGREMEVLPIAKLFYETDNGLFRYSCLYALSTMCLLHDVDVAAVMQQNVNAFGEQNVENVKSVSERFEKFRQLGGLVRQLSAPDEASRAAANEKLKVLAPTKIDFSPQGSEQERGAAVEAWKSYLLRDYWLAPRPAS